MTFECEKCHELMVAKEVKGGMLRWECPICRFNLCTVVNLMQIISDKLDQVQKDHPFKEETCE